MKQFLVGMLLLSVAFALWNAVDEYYWLASLTSVAIVTALWTAIPLGAGMIGLHSKKPHVVEVTILLAMSYALLYFLYALNGSTAGNQGAEHMHVLLVPVLMLIYTNVALLAWFVLVRPRIEHFTRVAGAISRLIAARSKVIIAGWSCFVLVLLVLAAVFIRTSYLAQLELVRLEEKRWAGIAYQTERQEFFLELCLHDPPVSRTDLEALVNGGRPFGPSANVAEGEVVFWQDSFDEALQWRFLFDSEFGLVSAEPVALGRTAD